MDVRERQQKVYNSKVFVALDLPLISECADEDQIVNELRECFENGADVNAVDYNDDFNDSVLHAAIRRKYVKIVAFLLRYPTVNVDVRNKSGETPLELARSIVDGEEMCSLLQNHSQQNDEIANVTNDGDLKTLNNFIKQQHNASVLKICRSNTDFLMNDEFWEEVSKLPNLFLVDLNCGDIDLSQENVIKTRLTEIAVPVIVQYDLLNHKKLCFKDLNSSELSILELGDPTESIDSSTIKEKLENDDVLTLELMITALKIKLIGNFQAEPDILTAEFDFQSLFMDSFNILDLSVRKGDILTTKVLCLRRPVICSETLEAAATHGDGKKLAVLLGIKFPIPTNRNFPPKQQLESLLTAACEVGNCQTVEFLLECGVEPGFNSSKSAWLNKHFKVLLQLLKSDAVFPSNFDISKIETHDETYQQLEQLVTFREELHRLIKEKAPGELIRQHLQKTEPSAKYLNKNNESAVWCALICERFDIFSWLYHEMNAKFRDQYERESLAPGILNRAKTVQIPSFVPVENAHLLYLVSKSRSAHQFPNFKNTVENYFQQLDKIPEVSTVLKVIQYCDQLDIIFDFESSSTADTAQTNESTKGLCDYKLGRIYVGAKNDIRQVLGTLAHECTHLSMQIVYQNDCKPHKNQDTEAEYLQILMNIHEQNKKQKFDQIVRVVFQVYKNAMWPAELIVRVNHILANFGTDHGLNILESQVPQLLEFYRKNVAADCKNFVAESHLIKPRNIIRLLNDYSGVINDFQDSKIRFKESCAHSPAKPKTVTCLVTPHVTLSAIHLLSCVEETPESFLVFKFNRYLNNNRNVNSAFYSDVCNQLILLCEDVVNIDAFRTNIQVLIYILKQKPTKSVILITENNDNILKIVNKETEHTEVNFEIKNSQDFSVENLKEETVNYIFQHEIMLQNHKIQLAKILPKDSANIIDAEVLSMLINKRMINLGKDLITSSSYDENYYVNRIFNHQATIKEEILTVEKYLHSIYVLSNTSEAKLKELGLSNIKYLQDLNSETTTKYILLHNDLPLSKQFDKVCESFPTKNVHHLDFVNGHFVWQTSKCAFGGISPLLYYVDESLSQTYAEEEFVENLALHRTVVVPDTAGMGKSTVLTRIAKLLKNKSPHLWIIRIDLTNYTTVLEEAARNKVAEDADEGQSQEFLVEKLLNSRSETKLETDFEKSLFLHLLNNVEDRLVFMFDGFDEIKERHQDVILDLLTALTRTKMRQLWVTTRPHLRESLEKRLNQLSYTLQPFDKKDQIDFLRNYWKHTLKLQQTSDKLGNFAEAVIELLSTSISDRERIFTGVPLQIRMVAESFLNDVNNFYNSNEETPKLPKKLDLLDLYQQFVQSKYVIFQEQKNSFDMSKPNVEDQMELLQQHFIRNHQMASLFTLFSQEQIQLLLTKEEIETAVNFMNNISNMKVNTGIIELIVDTKPRFVHLTFAEYLAAEIIVNLITNPRPSLEFVKLVAQNVFFLPEFRVLRAFINNHLASRQISPENLREFGSQLKITWAPVGKYKMKFMNNFLFGKIRIFEEGKPTVLHVAAEEGNANIAEFLFKCLGVCNISENLLKCTNENHMQPLHLAAEKGNFDVVKILVQNRADVNAAVVGNKQVFDGYTPIYFAAFYRHHDICEWLIKNGADVTSSIKTDGYYRGHNLIHWAAAMGELELLKFLKNLQLTAVNFKAPITINDKKAGATAAHVAACEGHWNIVHWMLTENLIDDINSPTKDGRTLLIAAVQNRSVEEIEWLIQNGADVNVGCDQYQYKALHIAANLDLDKIVAVLLASGADVNAALPNDGSALHMACKNGFINSALLLLATSNIDINAKNSKGQTPLHVAALNKHKQMEEMLMADGANTIETAEEMAANSNIQNISQKQDNREVAASSVIAFPLH